MMLKIQLCLVATLLGLCLAGQAPSKPQASTPDKAKVEIAVENVKFAVFERDLTEPKDWNSVNFNEKLGKKFSVGSHQKVRLQFEVKDKKAGSPITVHQAFVAMVNQDTKREVIYVAEPAQQTKAYTFELDMKNNAKDFSGLSGKYSLRLILGDASVSNPVDWYLADVSVSVPAVEPVLVPKSKQIVYDKLPEIKHQFREQEPRPPGIVSDAFSALCAAPILILLGLWLRVGINFGNVKFSLWTLGFHVGLAGIFGLYFYYWVQLNMFQTLQLLALVGVPTFICGNRLLNSFTEPKKMKAE